MGGAEPGVCVVCTPSACGRGGDKERRNGSQDDSYENHSLINSKFLKKNYSIKTHTQEREEGKEERHLNQQKKKPLSYKKLPLGLRSSRKHRSKARKTRLHGFFLDESFTYRTNSPMGEGPA